MLRANMNACRPNAFRIRLDLLEMLVELLQLGWFQRNSLAVGAAPIVFGQPVQFITAESPSSP